MSMIIKLRKTVGLSLVLLLLGCGSMHAPVLLPPAGDSSISASVTSLRNRGIPVEASSVPAVIRRNRLIHLSDFHYGVPELTQNFYRVMKQIDEKFGPKAGESVIIITGDLVDIAERIEDGDTLRFYQKEYAAVAASIDTLRQKGFLVLLVDGNHDLKVKDTAYQGKNANRKENYVKLDLKKEFCAAFYMPQEEPEKAFPLFDIIDGIAYIGIDVMDSGTEGLEPSFLERRYRLYYRNDEVAFGIGSGQLDRLSGLIAEIESGKRACTGVVIYMHHIDPPRENADFRRFFERLAALKKVPLIAILSGHTHRSSTPGAENGSSLPIFVAGTTTGKCSTAGRAAGSCDDLNNLIILTPAGEIEKAIQFSLIRAE
jgi:hypothetical protein